MTFKSMSFLREGMDFFVEYKGVVQNVVCNAKQNIACMGTVHGLLQGEDFVSITQPDRYFSRISRISIQRDLVGCGLTHVLLDIDNTILTRDTHEIPRDVMVWLRSAQQAGVEFCLVSNNCHSGVFDLAEEIGLPIVAKSLKPLPHGFLRGRAKIGGCKSDTVVIGDQLSTDIFGAKVLGMTSYLVLPLVDADLKHTLVLRKIERVLLGKRLPEGLDEPEDTPAGAEPAYVEKS